jgi:LPS-assembly protein
MSMKLYRKFSRSLGHGAAALAIAAALGLTSQAFAQSASEPEKTVALYADELIYNSKTGEVTAIGDVQVTHEGFELLADQVFYNEETGIVRAIGNLRLTDPDGNVMLLDEAELTDSLREGFINNVRLVLNDGSRLAAKDGQRFAGRRTTFNYVAYTPCEVCVRGDRKKPVWLIKAVKVIHDQETKRLFYKDMVLEMFGLPVAYLPYFSHPDPSVKRASGFLIPEIKTRRELGVTLALPYYHVFSPSQDATITPIITTKEGLVLAGQYRQKLRQGSFQVDGSGTYAEKRDDNNFKTGGHEFRGHMFSQGQLQHDEHWRTSYSLRLASDDTYLRRYSFSEEDTLTSEIRTEGFYGRSYASLRSLWFQGLRQEDVQGETGYALPFIEYDYVSRPGVRGSVYRGNFSALALRRSDGMDTRRFSVRGSWEIPYTTRWGQKLRLSAHIRGDLYDISDSDRPDNPFFGGSDGTEGRILPMGVLDITWPLAKFGTNSQQILEPILSLIVTRKGGNPSELSNEDSRVFELTDANIFSANRFAGLDRWEGGSRINYGFKWTLETAKIRSEILLGQSYRFVRQAGLFPDGSGLSGNFSDIVGRWDLALGDKVDIAHRFRLDKNSFRVRRNEIDVALAVARGSLSVGYFQLNRNHEFAGLEDREEVRASAQFRIKNGWSLFGSLIQDLTDGDRPVSHGVGLLYVDECLEVSLGWRKSFTSDRDIVPGSSVNFRIRLKNLG